MKTNLTKIRFHGKLGKLLNREFQVKVSPAREAVRAADYLSGKKITKFFLEDRSNLEAEYRILIDGKEMAAADKKIDTIEKAMNSEYVIKNENIETVDIIPVIKGGNLNTILGALLIVLAAVIFIASGGTSATLSMKMFSLAVASIGVGLLGAGIAELLAEPPKFEDFKDPGKKAFGQSYLFDGPKSTAGEGNPVPLGYGRLIIGGLGISATYETLYRDSRIHTLTS